MKLIVCLDERRGMMFNHRRQSRDRVLIENMERLVGAHTLYVTSYSEILLLKSKLRYVVADDPFAVAGEEDYCLIESFDPAKQMQAVEEAVLYHWNRHYPADLYFTADMKGFTLIETEEFAGSSHEKITREVWRR